MKYLCIKSVSIGEKDTSPLTTEVFTKNLEYECVNGFLTDNIGVKRSIDKPKFSEHFEGITVLNGYNQELFGYMAGEHGLTLLQSEMHEIIKIVKTEQDFISRTSVIDILFTANVPAEVIERINVL